MRVFRIPAGTRNVYRIIAVEISYCFGLGTSTPIPSTSWKDPTVCAGVPDRGRCGRRQPVSGAAKYRPVKAAASSEEAGHTDVSAPFSGVRKNGRSAFIMPRLPLSGSAPMSVATAPGWRELTRTPVLHAPGQLEGKEGIGQFGAGIGLRGAVLVFISISPKSILPNSMHHGRNDDDARRSAGFQHIEKKIGEKKMPPDDSRRTAARFRPLFPFVPPS